MLNVGIYDAKDTSIIIDGTYITGLGEDMFSGEKNEDLFASSVGAQGDTVKSIKNDSRGKFTVYVQATSPQKSFLMSLKDRIDPFPVWAVNKRLKERVGGTMANLLSFPEVARGAEVEDMEFVFEIFDYTVEPTE